MKNRYGKVLILGALLLGSFFVLYLGLSPVGSVVYDSGNNGDRVESDVDENTKEIIEQEPVFVVTHIPVPDAVRAIYMTSCVASTGYWRESLAELVEKTELNSIVVDVKDYSGTIAFRSENPLLKSVKGDGCIVPDMKEFVGFLHDKGIYTIARITVFQDPVYTSLHPDLAVKKASDMDAVWKDYKGLSFIDAGAKEFWDYIVALSKESYAIGFDELNFDYIRFPSDGNMSDIYYPFSNSREKREVLSEFFAYLNNSLSDIGVYTSADLFGMTTTNKDDLNIGQVLEDADKHFDFIAPMVYPSHYPPTFNGYGNPNEYPYEVVKYSMDSAVERLIAASSSHNKLRPWLQDFDYGGNYDIEEVRAQKQAVYDAGLSSWMLWDPGNIYTRGALDEG